MTGVVIGRRQHRRKTKIHELGRVYIPFYLSYDGCLFDVCAEAHNRGYATREECDARVKVLNKGDPNGDWITEEIIVGGDRS